MVVNLCIIHIWNENQPIFFSPNEFSCVGNEGSIVFYLTHPIHRFCKNRSISCKNKIANVCQYMYVARLRPMSQSVAAGIKYHKYQILLPREKKTKKNGRTNTSSSNCIIFYEPNEAKELLSPYEKSTFFFLGENCECSCSSVVINSNGIWDGLRWATQPPLYRLLSSSLANSACRRIKYRHCNFRNLLLIVKYNLLVVKLNT